MDYKKNEYNKYIRNWLLLKDISECNELIFRLINYLGINFILYFMFNFIIYYYRLLIYFNFLRNLILFVFFGYFLFELVDFL